jgi:1,4-dihydroxy-2-naphthoate polyprenyltransferase
VSELLVPGGVSGRHPADGRPPRGPGLRAVAVAAWRMSRPEQVALILVVFGAGVAMAAGTGRALSLTGLVWGSVALALTAVSVHAVNEFADYDSDALTRRTAFSGGSGALHDLGLDRSWALAVASVAAVAAVTLAMVAGTARMLSPTALALLTVGLLLGWQYSVGPLALSRRGWGEVANAVLGGLVLPLFGVASVTGSVRLDDAVLFVPFTLLVFVNLLETQWADRAADQAVGKATLTSRLPAPLVRTMAAAATALAYSLLVVLTPDPLPQAVLLASAAALPFSLWAIHRITRRQAPLPAVLAMVVLVVAQGIAWSVLPR